jgi:hypothetical protein
MSEKKAESAAYRPCLVDCRVPSERWVRKERVSSEVMEWRSLSGNQAVNLLRRYT